MKVLILGASHPQVDAVRYLLNKGHEVHCCSYSEHDVAELECSYYANINILDVERLSRYIENNGIEVVYSIGSDIAIPSVMKLSEIHNLPHFLSSRTAMICQNKAKMRRALGGDFEGNVPFVVGNNVEELKRFNDFPAMVKPTDSQGQRGCKEIYDVTEIDDAFDKAIVHSASKSVIIEHLIGGDEISVNALFKNGSLICSVLSDRVSFDEYPGGIIKKHLVPSKYANTEVEGRVLSLVSRAAKKLELNNGPAYFQIKIQDGEPYIIEIAPRLDGCHMWSLIKRFTGIDLLALTLDMLVENEDMNSNYELEFFTLPPNTTFSKSNFETERVNCPRWYYTEGTSVKKMNGYMEKCGYHIEKKSNV